MFTFSVSISGFSGPPTTLVCVLDESGVLVVAKSIAFTEERVKDFAMVSNMDLQANDYRYTDDDMREAIRAYFTRMAQGLIDLVDELSRFQPHQAIEKDQIDESGPRYRLSPDITNGQLAVLAAVSYAERQSPLRSTLDAMDEITKLYEFMSI